MNRRQRLLLAIGLLAPCMLSAHEGGGPEPLDEKPVASPRHADGATPRPQLLADGRLYVPKAVQHLLGLRTEVVAAQAPGAQLLIAAEVVAAPNAAGRITAEQAGQLEAPTQGWPLPGGRVRSGEMLATLHPLLSQREQAQRRAALAQIDEDLQIAEINVARLKLQADASGTAGRSGNVYYEEARLEWEGLQKKYQLESEALDRRVAVRAPADGVLVTASARPGDVVTEGQALFEVADPAHLRVAVRSFDTTLPARLQSARLVDDSHTIALVLRGQEPLAGQQGWRLLFDAEVPPTTALTPGQIVDVALQVLSADAGSVPVAACVQNVAGNASVWIHVAPDHFEPRSLPSCRFGQRDDGSALTIKTGERVVTQGAELLSEYR